MTRAEKIEKCAGILLDAFKRRCAGFPLGYEMERAIEEGMAAALAPDEESKATCCQESDDVGLCTCTCPRCAPVEEPRASDHPTVATVLAAGPSLKSPCVYCGTQYRSEPCGAVHAGVRRALEAPVESSTDGSARCPPRPDPAPGRPPLPPAREIVEGHVPPRKPDGGGR